MRLFKFVEDSAIDERTLATANKIKASLIESHGIPENYLAIMLLDSIENGHRLWDIIEDAEILNPIELRTIAYLLSYEDQREAGAFEKRSYALINQLALDHEKIFENRESLGDSIYKTGISSIYWCFSINEPRAQREMSIMLYQDICSEELFITDQAGGGWEYNIQTFIPVSIRHLMFGKDQIDILDRINHDAIDVPQELYDIVSEEFFSSSRSLQEEKLARAIDAMSEADGLPSIGNLGMSTPELLRSWPMEYGRVQIILNNLSLEEVIDRASQVAELIVNRDNSIELKAKQAIVEKFVKAMLLPFPEKFKHVFPKTDISDLFDYPSKARDLISDFFSASTICENYGLFKGATALINILDGASLEYDAYKLSPLINKFPSLLSSLLESEENSSQLSSDLLMIWLQTGDHSNPDVYDLNRVFGAYQKLNDPSKVHQLNLYKVQHGFKPEYKLDDLKEMMVKDLVEKNLLTMDVLVASGLAKDDFNDYLASLDSPAKRLLIGSEMDI